MAQHPQREAHQGKTQMIHPALKEFTAFFAVPVQMINDDNEIEQKIAEITGAKCKETWLTGQTAQEQSEH